MALNDLWNKITGKAEPEKQRTDEPGRDQQRFEQGLAKDLSEQQARLVGNHPDQVAAREEISKARADAGKAAKDLQKPGPAERMVSYKDLFTEPTREALKNARETKAVEKQEIAEGTRPPFKSYAELHPNEAKTPQR